MRHKITNVLPLIAFLFAIVQGASAIAQQPASPAQLAAWQSQITALQNQRAALQSQRAVLTAQQQADNAEAARMQVGQQNAQAQIKTLTAQENFYANIQKNPALAAGQAWAQGKSPGEVIAEALTRNVDVGNRIGELRQYIAAFAQSESDHRAAVAAAGRQITQIDVQITQIDSQIAQLERTIAYYRNPLQGDLANEQARLDNLRRQQKQKALGDDAGQLGWDINNTQKRIDQIQQAIDEFNKAQQGGAAGTGAGGQQQGSYGSPAAGTPGTGPQSQVPAGYDPYLGAAGIVTPGSSMPTHQGLRGRFPPQTTGGSTHSGPSGTTTTTSGTKQPTTGSSTAGAQAPVRPPSGATCGPATSCTCAGGGRGHIPCDADKGPCHCGGG